jgi:uncharacterized membrane protein YphA (DoxX/SURF4 family)
MHPTTTAALIMRFGLAFVFGWMGIDKFIHLSAWYGWIPSWLAFVPQDAFLYAVGAIEVILAVLLIGGRFVRFAAIVCAVLMAGVVFSFGINDITVRDIGLIALALAIAMTPEHRRLHEIHQLVRRMRRV